MENVDTDYEVLEKGIKQVLGKEKYAPAEKMPPPCTHISDGFIYDKNPITTLLQCVKCSIQYEISSINGELIG